MITPTTLMTLTTLLSTISQKWKEPSVSSLIFAESSTFTLHTCNMKRWYIISTTPLLLFWMCRVTIS